MMLPSFVNSVLLLAVLSAEVKLLIGCGSGDKDGSVIPSCCDPCELLINPDSYYYQHCGRFLSKAELDYNYRTCVACKGNKARLKGLLAKFKNECYKRFITIVEFTCLPVEMPKRHWQPWDVQSLTQLQDICYKNHYYCTPPAPECDKCAALISTESQFYQVCGHAIDEKQRMLWYKICRYSNGHCQWDLIYSQIIGQCHCVCPYKIPDFCA